MYSIVNHQIGSNLVDFQRRTPALLAAALILVACLGSLILTGAFVQVDLSKGLGVALTQLTEPLYFNHATRLLVLAMLLTGVIGLLLSTADSVMLSVTMTLYEGLWQRDSFSTDVAGGELTTIRRLMTGIFVGAFLGLAAMFFSVANWFYMLLAIVSMAEVAAPLIVVAAVLAARPEQLRVISNKLLGVFLLLGASVFVMNAWASANAPTSVPYISLAHVALSGLVAAYI